ncbi:MAG: Pr6Pr family membrane protein [Promethearchaeota archaeon]
MKSINLSSKTILFYRIIFAGLSWFTLITSAIIYTVSTGSILEWFNSFKAFTMQTNLLVTIWFTLAILSYNNIEILDKITSPLKGAFTMYITITFVVFAILLSPFYQPTGYAAFSNIVLHYITPIAFIVDWVFTENKIRYRWNYLIYWIIYPLCYIIFIIIHGAFTGSYLYYFLDISELGIPIFFISISILLAFGIGLACLYILINRKRVLV